MGELQRATLGGGCYWCVEACFEQVKGVSRIVSGFSGGKTPAGYKEVCSGTTGHAEVLDFRFDPEVIDYATVLNIFFGIHDPTTLNRQGNDVGEQYRSVIFTHNDEQARIARERIQHLDQAGIFDGPIVTRVEPFRAFYPAGPDHQEYYRNNPAQPYCAAVISPKVAKFRKQFESYLVTSD